MRVPRGSPVERWAKDLGACKKVHSSKTNVFIFQEDKNKDKGEFLAVYEIEKKTVRKEEYELE